MGLNKSKGNMYPWVSHTWNTIKGKCPHGCTYCYMRKWGEQPELYFDLRELGTDLGAGRTIFVGSSCDMFAFGIPSPWISDTLEMCRRYPKNLYFFQSKNTERMLKLGGGIPPGSIVCTTIETNRIIPKIMCNSPTPQNQAFYLGEYLKYFHRFVTIEPIIDFDLREMVELINQCRPEQVNIGADSGRNNLPEPTASKIQELILELKKFTCVLPKKNLNRLLSEVE